MKIRTAAVALAIIGFVSGLTMTGNAQPSGGNRGASLDDQQRQLFKEALQKDSDKLKELDQKLRVAQRELLQATLAPAYDEKVVREKAEAVARIEVEITVLRSKALATVAPSLKPEQKTGLTESRFAIYMLTTSYDPMADQSSSDRNRSSSHSSHGGPPDRSRGR
jgi:Spy/CpxP family protein refolding chaperone